MKASPRFLLVVMVCLFTAGFAVSARATCTPGSTVPSVTICSPSATSNTPMHVTAAGRASTTVKYMAVWLDGVKKYQVYASSVDTSLSTTTGQHRLTVQAKDSYGNIFAKTIYTTVGSTTASTWSISGTLSPAMTGVTVALSGAKAASTTTNASGQYSFAGLANGTYTVTPSQSGTVFSPVNKGVAVSGANVTGVNFTDSTASSSHSVDLSWTASVSSTVSGYKVYRSTTSGGPYALLNGAPLTSTIYSDQSVTAGMTYFYVVAAVNSAGSQSSYSNQVSAKVPSP